MFNLIKFFLISFIVISYSSYADEINDGDGNDKKINFEDYAKTQDSELITNDLHAQLNAIFGRNQQLKSTLATKDESLNEILSTLKQLDEKLEYKLRSTSVNSNANGILVTMADFNSADDDLVRQCDEIVDNYYLRKSQQEKSYVQDLFNTEQNDPQWERDTEDSIHNFIASNNLDQSEFLDVKCSASVCKVRVQHKSSEAGRQFKNNLRGNSGFDVFESRNKLDRVTGGIITNVTLLKDRKKIREFIWGR